MNFTPQEKEDFARAESKWLTPPDVSEIPQPNDKCTCGHIANNHHGVAWLCWVPSCDCAGFSDVRKEMDTYFYENAKFNGAD